MCALQDKIYAVGGSDAWDCLNSVEVYDPLIDEWSDGVPMATCRRGAGVCVYKGRLGVDIRSNNLGKVHRWERGRGERYQIFYTSLCSGLLTMRL